MLGRYLTLLPLIIFSTALLNLLTACSEPPRGIVRDQFFYAFDPIELTDSTIQDYTLHETQNDVDATSKIADIEKLSISDESFLRLAITTLASRNLFSPSLQFISYESACDRRSNPDNLYFAFVLRSDEVPAFPYILAWVQIWVDRARIELSSSHVQEGWYELANPTFTYPVPVSFQHALTIIEENGGKQAEDKLGEQCEFHAVLRPKTWEIGLRSKDAPQEQALFDIMIDVMTGEVISINWVDTMK